MELYLNSNARVITNKKGQEVSLDNAKHFWKTGQVSDCSQSFQRLANLDFDFDALDLAYQEMNK